MRFTPKMPEVKVLKARKTEYRQMDAIFRNEGTIKGTSAIHNKIFLD